jgi:hypothetical protein
VCERRHSPRTGLGLPWVHPQKAGTITVQLTNHSSSDQQSASRKLALKKETLRQLTNGELRQVAGGNPSGGSAMSSGTSVISVSISGSISGRPSH